MPLKFISGNGEFDEIAVENRFFLGFVGFSIKTA